MGDGRLVGASAPGYLQLTPDQMDHWICAQPIEKFYDVEEQPFARGKFAAVKLCKHKKTGEKYAAKFLRKQRHSTDTRPEILHEVAILDACAPSPRIVKLHQVFENDEDMILVLELAPGGELQMLLDQDLIPDEHQVKKLMKQILDGLIYLHSINVAHLDLKPQNLVLMDEFPYGAVKICDLGISRYISENSDIRDILGTPDYVAPEVLNYEPISLATDMWSVGVLLYVLLTGCSPFGGDTKQETFCNISRCDLDFPDDLFEGISEAAKDLMCKLMVKDPSQRLTAQQCLLHPWFKSEPTTVIRSSINLHRSNSLKRDEKVTCGLSRTESIKREEKKRAPGETKLQPDGEVLIPETKEKQLRPPLTLRNFYPETMQTNLPMDSLKVPSEDLNSLVSFKSFPQIPAINNSLYTTFDNYTKLNINALNEDYENRSIEQGSGISVTRKNKFKKNMDVLAERHAEINSVETVKNTDSAKTQPTNIVISINPCESESSPTETKTFSTKLVPSNGNVGRLIVGTTSVHTLKEVTKPKPSQFVSNSVETKSLYNNRLVNKATAVPTMMIKPRKFDHSVGQKERDCFTLNSYFSYEGKEITKEIAKEKGVKEHGSLHTFRKCIIIEEASPPTSIASSETSSGFSEPSISDSGSDCVSEMSADSASDRSSIVSLDDPIDYNCNKVNVQSILHPAFRKTLGVNSSYTTAASLNNIQRQLLTKKEFDRRKSMFTSMLNNSSLRVQDFMKSQSELSTSSPKHTARSSSTTVISNIIPPLVKPCAPSVVDILKKSYSTPVKLNSVSILPEHSGNSVILREIRSGKHNKFSDVKCESVKSRIKKFEP